MMRKFWLIVVVLLALRVSLWAAASYPSAVKSFPVRADGQTIVASWFNEIHDEVVAIENGLISGLGHTVKPLTDAAYDLGTSGLSWRDGWFSRNVDIEGTLAADGASTLGSTLAVTGNTTLSGTLAVTSTTAFTGAVTSATTFSSATPIILSHASGGIRERARAFQIGEMQSVAHSDANYIGDGTDGNWVVASGDQQVFKYTLIGKILHVAITIATSTVANTPTELRVVVPGGTPATTGAGGAFYLNENGTTAIGRWYVSAGGAVINFAKIGAVWANATDTTTVQADIRFEVD